MKSACISLSVKSPCHENWDSMKQLEQHKFCDQCAKKVYDLTQYKDRELVEFFSQNKDEICGRFNTQQVNRNLNQEFIKPTKTILPKVAASLLLLGLNSSSYSTTQPTPNTTISAPLELKTPGKKELKKGRSGTTIKGKVFDHETKEELIGVNVIPKEFHLGVSTDFYGNFEFFIPDSLVKDSIQLEISYIGYKTQTLSFPKNEVPEQLQINMYVDTNYSSSCEFFITGRSSVSIALTDIDSAMLANISKASWWWWVKFKLKTLFKSKNASVF